jgi:hypothetical protein
METIKLSAFILGLLAQINPGQVVWNTMSGPFTAQQMHELLLMRDHTALCWVSDHLRVMRDIFGLMAEKGSTVTGVTPEQVALAQGIEKKSFISLLRETATRTGPVYWSPAHGQVSKEAMLSALAENNELAAQYVACFVRCLENLLTKGSSEL